MKQIPTFIERYPQEDADDIIDLDNSVFRNFKRLMTREVTECISNDLRFWIGDEIITE